MTIQLFMWMLFAFSVVSSLVTEAVKKLVSDKVNLIYNIVNLITAMIVAVIGCIIYYLLNDIAIGYKDIISIVVLGFFSALVAELGYDKVKQTIDQILGKGDN